jgi:hypothetical protein
MVCKSFICAVSTLITVISFNTYAELVVPDGLSPGDSYQVIFVTSRTAANIPYISYYDNFVNNAAEQAGIGSTIDVSWKAVVSTQTVNAKDHITPVPPTPDVPIYNQAGELVAQSLADLWDGQLDNPVRYDEFRKPIEATSYVWTGTRFDGTTASPLGTESSTYGDQDSTESFWINMSSAPDPNVARRSVYAISSTITVALAKPKPPTIIE